MFAPKCQGECHAVKAALCDLGDPSWGDLWFPHWALLLPAPFEVAHGDFVVFPVVFVLWACVSMTHKLSSACAELILSYHLLSQQIFFTQLEPVTSLLCGCVFFFCVLCGLFLFVFAFCVVFASGSLCFGSCFLMT